MERTRVIRNPETQLHRTMKPTEIPCKLKSTFVCFQPWIADAVLLFARLTIGWSFFLTGKGKLANLDRTAGFFESLGIPAPGFHAGMVGGIEMIGGLLLIGGLLTRVASIPLAGAMVVAYLTAHRDEAFVSLGDFVDQAPYAYLLVALVLLTFGPGRLALDRFWPAKCRIGGASCYRNLCETLKLSPRAVPMLSDANPGDFTSGILTEGNLKNALTNAI